MRVAVCVIAKLENLFIREFVEYYKKIGVDNIILYDNNDIEGERFEDVIGDYIDSGFVIIANVRGRSAYQLIAYNECYSQFGNQYDWLMFFDVDEYLTFTENIDVKQFLSKP